MRRFRKPSAAQVKAQATAAGVRPEEVRLLGMLVDAGADLRRPRRVMYYLNLTSAASARETADLVAGDGWKAELRPPNRDYPDDWPVICSKENVILDVETVGRNSDYFHRLVADQGGTYDGWQATT